MEIPAWKKFEELIALIESFLSPQGAEVKSPDRIKDKVTGELREVDASINFIVGSTPILITIECRDRTRVQDDTWIEQIAMKREKIGAHATIAVSSSAFTEPAIRSAKQFGIELRTIRHFTGEEIAEWVNRTGIKLEVREWKCLSLQANLETKEPVELMVNSYDDPIIFREGDDEPLTLAQIGGKFVEEGQYPPLPGIRPFGVIDFRGSKYFMDTKIGRIRVHGFKITVEVTNILKDLPLKTVLEYRTMDRPLVQVASFDYPRIDGGLKIEVLQNLILGGT